MTDVKGRLANRVQLTTDGHKRYLMAVDNAFDGDVDYAMIVKLYGHPEGQGHERKYSAAECMGAEKKTISGNPNEKFVSTSYVERQNLTMGMYMRRFTRLTDAFSKKVENHCYAIALHFLNYNFVKINKSLSVTPAMQAGLMKKPMTLSDVVNLVSEEHTKKRGSYKKRETE
jgi:hypothetical protein